MSRCQQCGLQVFWKTTGVDRKGRATWQCFQPDGVTPHWDLCSQERNRKARAEGTPFKDAQGEGVIYQGKKKYMHMVARTEYGKPVPMPKEPEQ